jgi:formamidopyrimidine-DNA glycosylase
MPELPEVETIASYLRQGTTEAPSILGKKITRGELLWERTLATPRPEEFFRRISGQVILDTGRRGKLLLLTLDRDLLAFHLRMSGDILVRPATSTPLTHDRLILFLDENYQLAFNDTRKFGRVWLLSNPEELFNRLGPEPLDSDFGPNDLHRRLQTHRRQLKPLLLDQTFLAGLGNIYSDEALHLARLHPLTLSHTLSEKEAERLWQSIRQVLKDGIRLQGASIDWVYKGGDFQNYFRVYKRTGLSCPACDTAIKRIIVGQRSTHYCPVCQPEPKSK